MKLSVRRLFPCAQGPGAMVQQIADANLPEPLEGRPAGSVPRVARGLQGPGAASTAGPPLCLPAAADAQMPREVKSCAWHKQN